MIQQQIQTDISYADFKHFPYLTHAVHSAKPLAAAGTRAAPCAGAACSAAAAAAAAALAHPSRCPLLPLSVLAAQWVIVGVPLVQLMLTRMLWPRVGGGAAEGLHGEWRWASQRGGC